MIKELQVEKGTIEKMHVECREVIHSTLHVECGEAGRAEHTG
jgi:hypothetical protein